MIPNGGFGGHGRLILTKVFDETINCEDQLLEIVSSIKIPCMITIDGNGFLEKNDLEKTEIIFCQASANTGIEFPNGKNVFQVYDKNSIVELKKFVETLTDDEFYEKWFLQHDKASDLRGSGFQPRRLINLVVTLDPLYLSVSKLV